MAWTDQCKYAFKSNVELRLWRKDNKKGIIKILKELSAESGIPYKTLYRWWKEQESLKTETNGISVENNDKNGQEMGGTGGLSLCKECGQKPVYIDARSGKPYGPNSKSYGLCSTCRNIKTDIRRLDKVADKSNGIMTICPECGHEYHINKNRIPKQKEAENG